MRRLTAIVVACGLAAIATAHQVVPLAVPPGELGEAPPPIRGGAAFLAEAFPLLRPRCDEAAAEKLDEIERLLRDAERVRWGAVPGADARVAEHLRARAEKQLVELLPTLRGAVPISLDNVRGEVVEVAVDPRDSSLLLTVDSGEGLAELAVVDWDLTGEAFDRETVLDVASAGVTHAVVRLSNVPEDDATIRFAVRRRGETNRVVWQALRLRTPPTGRLIVSLRDDGGGPTHALLSIRSVGGGVYFEPPGAVDLRAQLNDVVGPPVSEPGRGYMFFLPGERRGRYWVAPPETDVTLAAGQWEVRALRGPEHTPVVERVTVEEGGITRVECRPRRWTDQAAEGWWSGDDHVHARLMGGADAERLLDYSEAVDLNVANILEMGDPLRTYYEQRGFGRDFRVRRGDHWLVPGQEDPRSDLGHAIGLNLDQQVRDLALYLQNDLLAEAMHAGGGLYGHTHVGANACFVHREMALFQPLVGVDFNSVMQAALGTELYYDFLNLGFRMTASAGADTPYGGTVGATRVYAEAGRGPLDVDAWFAALRAGKTFVSNGPMLRLRVEGRGPGETLHAASGRPLGVKVTAIGDPGFSSPKRLAIVRCGAEARVVESGDSTRGELSITSTIDPGDGCWIAAHAVGHDGSEALSTPVYVAVGDRAWHGDRRAAPELARKQLAVLDEIDAMVADAERRVAEGRQPLDLAARNTASQANAVRERVERARAFYESLIAQLQEP